MEMVIMGGTGKNMTHRLRWIARVYGSTVAALWSLIGIGGATEEGFSWSTEGLMMTGFVVVTVAAAAVAWWREWFGGVILSTVGLAFCLFAVVTANDHRFIAMMVSGVPILVAGILFLASWRWYSAAGSR
jgi:hypothetical protein